MSRAERRGVRGQEWGAGSCPGCCPAVGRWTPPPPRAPPGPAHLPTWCWNASSGSDAIAAARRHPCRGRRAPGAEARAQGTASRRGRVERAARARRSARAAGLRRSARSQSLSAVLRSRRGRGAPTAGGRHKPVRHSRSMGSRACASGRPGLPRHADLGYAVYAVASAVASKRGPAVRALP
jgi:hypothetical protein